MGSCLVLEAQTDRFLKSLLDVARLMFDGHLHIHQLPNHPECARLKTFAQPL